MDFRIQDQLLFKWKCSGTVVIKTTNASNNSIYCTRCFKPMNIHPKDRARCWHCEEIFYSTSQYYYNVSKAWVHKWLLSKSNGNFSSKVSDLIPRGVCQKMGGKKCFFHLLNHDVVARNI